MPILITAIQHHTIRQEERIKGIHIGKEQVQLSLLTDNMVFYLEKPRDSTRLDTVAHTCNPSYSGGWGTRIA